MSRVITSNFKSFFLFFRNKCSHVCPDVAVWLVVCLIGTDLSSSFTSSPLIVCMKQQSEEFCRRRLWNIVWRKECWFESVWNPVLMLCSLLSWALESRFDHDVSQPVPQINDKWAWRQHRKSTQRQTLCFIRPQQHSLTNELTNNGLMGRKKM